MTEITDAATKRLIQHVARETAECVSKNVANKAVRETLISIGIDPSDPIAAQEVQSNMRKVADLAPSLTSIAALYDDPETRDAIVFAKTINKAYKSTRNRAVFGLSASVVTVWATGLWNKIVG